MTNKLCFIVIILNSTVILGSVIRSEENSEVNFESYNPADDAKLAEQEKNFWQLQGDECLMNILKQADEVKRHVAKNVIIFVGDGMGTTTATAARIYKGQRQFGLMGEEHRLTFDKFPNVALVKTYNVDRQVPDSAGTATALFTGVKTRARLLGLDAKISVGSVDQEAYKNSKLDNIMVWAQHAGKYTGLVSTAKVTDATPAALYATISHRDWECDSEIPEIGKTKVKDVARQLVEDDPGKNFRVILSGGLQQLGHVHKVNPTKCSREDNLNLTQVWIDSHKQHNSKFVTNTQGLESVTDNTEYLLGLFDADHLPYELVRNKGPEGSPSLSAMTQKAIQLLKKGPEGFVLMVEGGRIDHAHHKNYARLAISEAAEMDEAVSVALNETGPDTLILVTSDHSHTLTWNGYAKRGNDIMGFSNDPQLGNLSYFTLSYGNGPGFKHHFQPSSNGFPWRDAWNDLGRLHDPWYQHLAAFFKPDETHGGEDVPLYAIGPSSHLVKGVIEQNVVAHIMSYAACIGPQARLNKYCPNVAIK